MKEFIKNNLVRIHIEPQYNDYAMIASTLCSCSVGIVLNINPKTKEFDLKGLFGIDQTDAILNEPILQILLGANTKFEEQKVSILNYKYYASYAIKNKGETYTELVVLNTEYLKLSENQIQSFKTITKQASEFFFSEEDVTTTTLIKSNEFYENCLSLNNIGLWQLDVPTLTFKLSDVGLTMLGYDIDNDLDFSFDSFLGIVYDKNECKLFINKLISQEIDSYEHKIRVRHKKGYWSWTKIHGRVTKWNEKGKPLLVEGFMGNIHDNYTSELQFKSIIDYVNCLAFRHIIFDDRTEEIVHLTDGTEKLIGYSKEELNNNVTLFLNSIHEDDVDKLKTVINKCLTDHVDWNEEFRIHNHLDSSVRWVKGYGNTIVNNNGSVSIDTVIVDVTSDKEKNAEFIYLNEKLNQAQNISNLGYFEVDYVNDTEYWSDKIYDIFGLSKSVKKSFETIISLFFDEDRKLIIKKYEDALKFDKEFKNDSKLKRPNGKVIWVRHIGSFTKNKKGELLKFECTVQDITDSKITSIALEDSIQRYNYVMQATSDAVWDLDFVNQKLYWGDNYYKFYGHPSLESAEDNLKYWGNSIHPDDRKRIIDSFDSFLESNETNWEGHYRFANSENNYFHVIDKGFIIRDEKGEPVRMVGAIHDVTDKLKAIEEIKWSKDRFEKIAEATNDAIWEWDFINNNVFQGPGYSKIFGIEDYSASDAFEVWKNKVHPEDLPGVIGALKLHNATCEEKNFKNEYRFLKKDGSYATVDCRGTIMYNDEGDAVRVLGATEDITDKLKAIEDIKISNERFERITSATSDAIYDIDFITGKIFRGDNYKKLFGYSSVAMLSDDINYWEDRIHPEDRSRVVNSYKLSVEKGGETWEEEYRFKNINDKYSNVLDKALFVRNAKGEPIRMVGAMQDVTDKLQAIEDIKISNERFEKITNATSDAIYDIDFVSENVFRGDNYKKLFGYSHEEMLTDTAKGTFWESKIHPNDRKRVVSSCESSIAGNDLNWEEEYRFKNINDEYSYVIDKALFVRNNKGELLRMVGAIQDVTEKIKAIEEVRRSNERFEKIAEATNDAIWDWDVKNNYLYQGPGYYELFGHEHNENLDAFEVWKSQVHPEDISKIIDSIKLYNPGVEEHFFKNEYRFLKADGTYANVEDRGTVIYDKKGNAVRLLGATQDITEKLRSIEQIKQANERFEKIAEATNDAIWDCDLEKNTVVYGYSHFRLFGYKELKEDDAFQVWKQRIHPDDYERVGSIIEGVLQPGGDNYFNIDYRYLKADGSYANVTDRGSVITNDKGEAIRMVGAFQDISDRTKYEESLKELNYSLKVQATELSRYNEELEQFAYVVSHDLQEPLRMITSFLTLLEKKYNEVIDDDGKKYIHFAVDGAKRMRQIILDLLDFSRVGRSDDELETLDLNILVDNIKLIFQQEIEAKHAKISIEKLPIIKSYKVLIEQLFQNLMGNALKYQKEENSPVVSVSYEDIGTHHKFVISDNGIGIDTEYYDKIFVIFQRLHGRNTYNGTGIGLALAKKIIDTLEGEIWVESELGVGSNFFFTIKKKNNILN
ncbi:PAS domain-containing protein [Cellulophaga baltica]|uniref:PAS domain-containing protein n=1 Tax=Cellulophaga TaxID=104264 RepID=UPI001C0752D5|nr:MULTISPECIES: PAS domain-containing protein [Cellulophaga]MBU2995273.1 PAS domain-containing protein [Cellulophaga baltica]MDO6766668.1 PAS domain-containing protein [Cellulophaga sp. 1_MG-2023]